MDPDERGQNERPIPAPLRGVVAPMDVTVAGGDFSRAVVGTQIVNKNTVVHHHGAGTSAENPILPPGHFCLNALITVSEVDPISRDSRIYRAKLHSAILDDLEIVVKILSDGERQRREARIHYLVPHHRNIVERIMTDTFKYQGQSCIYIAMEQCDAQNLHAYVVSLAEANAPYDAEMFMDFAFQIATGLEFLHRHKILNRDLKPENILLSADKTIAKIADFGMSKEMIGEAATVSALQPGTDGWRSPEILKNDERITLASDIFSLGLIFHFLWSFGKHAFGDDHHAWNLYIKRGNMILDGLKIPNINAARALLTSMFKQNSAKRPNALEVLRNDVFKGTRLQCDAAAIYSDVSNTQDSGTIKNRGAPDFPQQGSSSFLGKIWRKFDKKPAKKTRSSTSGELFTDLPLQTRGKSFEDLKEESTVANSNSVVLCEEKNTELERESVKIFDTCFVDSFAYGRIHRGEMNGKEVLVWQWHIDEEVMKRFQEMLPQLSNFDHPNIIKFLGQILETPYLLVTEFMSRTLLDYLRTNGKRITPDIFDMATQVASGMEYITSKGYVLRGICAESVMLNDHFQCKIADFSGVDEEGHEYYTTLPHRIRVKWGAPELLHYGVPTAKSCVWSFGILLYEMITGGGVPYPGMTSQEVVDTMEKGYRMPRPYECPEALYEGIILPCWEEAPDGRPTFEWLKMTLPEGRFMELMRESVKIYDAVDSFTFGEIHKGRMNEKDVLVWKYTDDYYKPSTDEFLALSVLEHPNIIKFYGKVSETCPCVLVTDFMPQTLLDYLRKNGEQITPDIFCMAAQVASGMEYISAKGYVHTNLRAASVMVDDDLNCKIADFSKPFEKKSYDCPKHPVPIRWTAQEFFGDVDFTQSAFSTKSDVWSFGILLTEMVTGGRGPYPGMSNHKVAAQMTIGYRMRKPEKCPEDLYYGVIMPCWEEDPDKRPTFEWLKKTMQDFSVTARIEGGKAGTDATQDVQESVSVGKQVLESGTELKRESVEILDMVNSFMFANIHRGRMNMAKVLIWQCKQYKPPGFQNIVKALSNLEHPNIIKFYGQVSTTPYLVVTEFMPQTLLDYLEKNGEQITPDIFHMAAQVASGMEYISTKGYVHCDLRAASVRVDDDLNCKIADFALTHEMGTFAENVWKFPFRWTAPEGILYREFSTKSEVWSFGILLTEMVTGGRLPYPGMLSQEVIVGALYRGYHMPKPEKCPVALYEGVMMPCWDMDPDKRPTFEWLKKTMQDFQAVGKIEGSEMSFGKTFCAIYNYDARDDTELSLKENDIIMDVDTSIDPGWWLGTLHGKRALVPSNYIKAID